MCAVSVKSTSKIYKARTRMGDGSVERIGPVLSVDNAVNLRQSGIDVVACGPKTYDNREVAKNIEKRANGRYTQHKPHRKKGNLALPHYQPEVRPPEGHTFYETDTLKARIS